MIPAGEIVPASQGVAVAASTPIADVSSSTDPMEEDQPRPSFVQVQNQTLNQLNISADPSIVAEAHQEIARVRSEAQRVALLADSAVREANQRVAMVQGNSQVAGRRSKDSSREGRVGKSSSQCCSRSNPK